MKTMSLALCVACIPLMAWGRDARISPVAYLGLTDGYWEAWVTSPDGNGARALTKLRSDVSRVSWYPDGQRVFVNTHDGRWFSVAIGDGEISSIGTPLTGIVDAVLSPDGHSVAFSISTGDSIDDNDIWLYDLRTLRTRKLTQMPRLQHEPAWSVDGRSVYFLSGDGGQAHDIWRVNVESAATEQLTVNDLYHFDLAHRADGTLLYSSNRTGDYEIWSQQPGRDPLQLTYAPGLDARPTWSPDGQQFVFESTREGEVAIFRQSLAASDAVRISPVHQPARAPAWFSGVEVKL